MSDLEREIELELDDMQHKEESELNFEMDDQREVESELNFEMDDHLDEIEESELNFEMDDHLDEIEESELNSGIEKYTNRLYELVDRGFESSSEVDNVVNEVVRQMEVQYFWKNWKKKLKKLAKSKLGNVVMGAIKQNIPGFKALKLATQIVRNPSAANFKNLLKQSVLSVLLALFQVVRLELNFLKNLGGIPGQGAEKNREALENAVRVVKDGYETLSENIGDQILDPVEAAKFASKSFEIAYEKNKNPFRSYEKSRLTSSQSNDVQKIRVSRNVKKLVIYFE